MKLDDNIKKKMNFLQKLKNNNIVDERLVVSINYRSERNWKWTKQLIYIQIESYLTN